MQVRVLSGKGGAQLLGKAKFRARESHLAQEVPQGMMYDMMIITRSFYQSNLFLKAHINQHEYRQNMEYFFTRNVFTINR